MKLKLTAVAVLATFAIGAQAASTTIASGDITAVIGDGGTFDVNTPTSAGGTPGLSYKGVEFVNWGTPISWWSFGNTGSGYTTADSTGVTNPLGSTTYPAGAAATTTVGLNSLTFFQTATIVAANQLAVQVSFTNNGKDVLKGMYYGVGFDPDQGIPQGLGYGTANVINAQGAGASVSATAGNYTVTLANTTSASAVGISAYIDPVNCCTVVDPQAVFGLQAAGFANIADSSISLAYSLGDIAVGQTVTVGYNYVFAAVPEPETYALFMAGLGLMGFVARRRIRA